MKLSYQSINLVLAFSLIDRMMAQVEASRKFAPKLQLVLNDIHKLTEVKQNPF